MCDVDELPVNILSKLSSNYIQSISEKTLDELDALERLIYNSFKSDEVFETSEVLNYTKNDRSINFNDQSGLRKLRLPIEPPKRGKTGKKAKNKSKHSKNHENIIGRNLAEGYENFESPSLIDIYQIEDLLRCMRQTIELSGSKKECLSEFEVLTLRRTLLMLILVPFTKRSSSFILINWQGLTILDYDHQLIVDDPILESNDTIVRTNNLHSYCGLNFESIVSDEHPENEAGHGKSFYSFQKQHMNGIAVHLTAEIDTSTAGKTSDYVELKTQRVVSMKARGVHRKSHVVKLIHCWCQMVLAGCNHLLIGFKTKDLRLASMRYMRLNDVRNEIDNAKYSVDDQDVPITCAKIMNWMKLLIHWLRTKPPGAYNITYVPEGSTCTSHLKVTTIDATENTVNQRLPQWFRDYVHEIRSHNQANKLASTHLRSKQMI